MTSEELLREIASLPPEGKQRVAEFIARLRQHYADTKSANGKKLPALRDEEFIGMWADREDMQDSSAWVRNLRANEWMK